jgi:hypothetical protein
MSKEKPTIIEKMFDERCKREFASDDFKDKLKELKKAIKEQTERKEKEALEAKKIKDNSTINFLDKQ